MDIEFYKIYLQTQIRRYRQYEEEDLIDNNEEAAYRAKIIADAYEDAYKMLIDE